MRKKRIKKRTRLIALLSALATLAVGGIGTGLAFSAMAAVRSSSPASKGPEKREASPSLSISQKGKKPQNAVLAMPGGASYLEMNPGSITTPVAQLTGGNGYAISLAYGAPGVDVTFSSPSGISIMPFAFSEEFPYGSNGKFDPSQIQRWVMSGNYSSTLSVAVQNAPNDNLYPLLGGVAPFTGKLVKKITTSYVPSQGQTVQYAFQEACITNEKFTSGPENGKTMSEVLDGSSEALSPEECDAVFHKQVSISITFGGKTYSLGNQQQVEELMENLNYQTPSTNASYYNGPSIPGPVTIKADLSSLAMYFLGILYQDHTSNATVNVQMAMWPNTSTNNNALYSSNGALIQTSVYTDGYTPSADFWAQLFGDPNSYYTTSAPASDFNSQGDLSPSSAAGPLGAWFKAVSQGGQPLTRVKIQLYSDSSGSYFTPAYWDPDDVNNNAVGNNYSTPDALGTPPASKYQYFGWLLANQATFTLYSIPGHPGYFGISGLPAGTYTLTVEGAGEGNQYSQQAPSFNITLNQDGYSSPEVFSADGGNDDGFIDASSNTVVLDAQNPSPQVLGSDGKVISSPSMSKTVGSSNVFSYQLSSYLPFASSFSLSLSTPGYSLNPSSVKVAGIPLSTLEGHGASFSSSTLTLNSSALSYIESNGFLPATSTSPGGTSKILLSSAEENRVFSIAFSSYLNPSFKNGDELSYSLKYPGQTITGSFPAATTNGPANDSVPSTLTTQAPSSSTGLWFKDLNADGSASTGAKFLVQNSSGQYLEEDTSTSGAFEGWSWTSSPSSALEFSQRNPKAVFSFGGLQNGTYTVTQVAWPDSVGKSGQQNTGEQNWPGISPDLTGNGDPEWAGYPGHLGGKAGYNGSFQVTLGYSSPESMSTQADPAGLVDSSKDSIYAFAPVKMAPLVGGSLSSQAYQTETVGVPFTEGWEGYLPMAVTSPSSQGGSYYSSSMQVSFAENDLGLGQGSNSLGLEMDDPTASNVEVAGIPLSTLEEHGAASSSGPAPYNYEGYPAQKSQVEVYTITLPYSALQYLEENGKNAAGESLSPSSSSSNRLIIISFPAVMGTSFKNGGQFQQWMAMGGISVSNGKADSQNAWWNQNAGSGWGVYSSPLYTNGQADNSVPSSLSPSENSSNTGIWFKSLWYGTSTPAPGSKYTVENASGKYLTPVESDGTFEGWSWSTSPYDFTEQNSSAVFSFGGLADGTYTLTQVDPAKGATASTLSFTSSLSYPSPQNLKAVKDSLNLLDSSKGTVWAIAVPSSLPFTGGKMILLVSLSAVVLFGAGALFFVLRKRRRA